MKKKLSILIVLILAVALTFVFVACGEAGADGEAGKSAYEIAVDNGFVGTVEEWLESLKGGDGKDGENGYDGEDADIYDAYEAYLKENPSADLNDFLTAYLTVNYSDTALAAAEGLQSAVKIESTFTVTRPPSSQSAGGSGVVYKIESDYAYIITNFHVIYDVDSTAGVSEDIKAYFFGNEGVAVAAAFVGGEMYEDIAVIKVEASSLPAGIKAVTVGDSDEAELGERVLAIGNALGEGIAVSSGVISVKSEEIEMEALDNTSYINPKTMTITVMRTDTPINGGNSGGGLFNMRGELVGIVNAKTVDTDVEGMGYAIHINTAKNIADGVIAAETV